MPCRACCGSHSWPAAIKAGQTAPHTAASDGTWFLELLHCSAAQVFGTCCRGTVEAGALQLAGEIQQCGAGRAGQARGCSGVRFHRCRLTEGWGGQIASDLRETCKLTGKKLGRCRWSAYEEPSVQGVTTRVTAAAPALPPAPARVPAPAPAACRRSGALRPRCLRRRRCRCQTGHCRLTVHHSLGLLPSAAGRGLRRPATLLCGPAGRGVGRRAGDIPRAPSLGAHPLARMRRPCPGLGTHRQP